MALFDVSDIDKAPDQRAKGMATTAPVDAYLLNRFRELEDLLPDLQEEMMYHFVTMGKFSAHEVLLYVLSKAGPCEVWLCTWKISETPARMLVKALQVGRITKLHCLLEKRMTIKSPNALQLMQHAATHVKLDSVHAKVAVVVGAGFCAAISTSANMSENKRIEVGYVCTQREVVEFHQGWLNEKIYGEAEAN